MSKISQKPLAAISLLLLLSAFFFFFYLGRPALTDPDETFYAQSGREMLDRGEWATAYLYGAPQFEKPIFFYWLLKISYSIFGVNEVAARLPSALMGLAGVIGIYLIGAALFSKRAALLSAIILATNVEYIILSRACVTDMTLFVFMLFGVLFFLLGHLKGKGYFYMLSSAAFALAVLTKGPVAILLPGVVIALYFILTRDFKAIKNIPIISCILVFLAVSVPWYAVCYKLHGKEFIDVFFGFHNVTRFLEAEHKVGSQWYYNIPILFGGFLPWSVFLPLGFWRIFKKSRKAKDAGSLGSREGSIFLLIWFFVIFLFFSASSTKLPTYIFPCFITAAIAVGVLWDDFLKGLVGKSMKFSYWMLPVAIILGSIGMLVFVYFDSPMMLKGVVISALFLVIGIVLSSWAFANKRYAMSFGFIVLALALFLCPASKFLLPEVDRYETSKEIALKLKPLMKEGERLGTETNCQSGIAFYTGKFPVDLDKHHDMVKFVNSKDRVWIVMKEKNHRQLYDIAINHDDVKPSYMLYSVGKRAIVTNDIPEGCPYVIKREKAR